MSVRDSNKASTAQLLFLFDVSSIDDVIKTDTMNFSDDLLVEALRSIIVQVSLFVTSSMINIITKAIDLKIPPPILRYRSKAFYPIHTPPADLNNVFAYIKSMLPQVKESSFYIWDVIKLYLLQALSDYPWNNSQTEANHKFIFIFSNCLNSLDQGHLATLLPALTANKVNENYLQVCSFDSVSSILSNGIISDSSTEGPFKYTLAASSQENQYLKHNLFKQITNQHGRLCNTELLKENSGSIKRPSNASESEINRKLHITQPSNNALADVSVLTKRDEINFQTASTSEAGVELRTLFQTLPGVDECWYSDEVFLLFLFFYFLFTEASNELIFECLVCEYDHSTTTSSVFYEFCIMNSDTRLALNSLLISNDANSTNGTKLKNSLSEKLFYILTTFISYFQTKPIKRSISLLRILFAVSPVGYKALSTFHDFDLYLDELSLSFLISDSLLNISMYSMIDKDIELLNQLLNCRQNRWDQNQISKMKDILMNVLEESMEFTSDSESVTSSAITKIDNSDLSPTSNPNDLPLENSSSQSQTFFSGNGSGRYFLYQTNSLLTSVEVSQSQGKSEKQALTQSNSNQRILAQETPTKHLSCFFTPKRENEEDQNIIVAQTPNKFISCKRALQY